VSKKPPVPWWMPRPSRWSQYVALVLVVVAIVVAVTIGKRTYDTLMEYPERPGQGTADPIALEVPAGASFPQVLDLLVQHGVIPEDEAMYFKVYVLHRGAARKTTAGPHTFRGDMTPSEIVEELARQQKAEETTVTIPEGKNILEIAQLLAEAGLSDPEALEAAMRDPKLLEELQIPGETVEGYLFPDTYRFATSAPPAEIVRRMVERHRKVFAGLRRRYRTEAQALERELEWSDHEIVTLASIVEKETAAKHERPLIAGVFLNRLKFSSFKPKLLQTDPTIVYGCTVPEKKSAACEKFEGRIRTIHLRDQDNPYSTYAHEGLPPGPISNPGKAALEAVFAPKKSRFLYFVSRNDGTHQFSKTVAEHERYVDEFQRKGRVGDGSPTGAADGG
jgi:UPF0755 protein